MSDNLGIYNLVRKTPDEARKTIVGGRLKGFTDINPQYRIECLTKLFGPCGTGWFYVVEKQWTEQAGDELLCFVNINLFYIVDGDWSKPVFGTGGSSLYRKEGSGLYATDEGYKMATTDAISVACKQLGIGADVYWEKGESKYNRPDATPVEHKPIDRTPAKDPPVTVVPGEEIERRNRELAALLKSKGMTRQQYDQVANGRKAAFLSKVEYEKLISDVWAWK